MNNYINILMEYIDTTSVKGNNSHFQRCINRIREADVQEEAAAKMLNVVARGVDTGQSAANLCMQLGKQVGYVAGYKPTDPPPIGPSGQLTMGMHILDWFAQEGWIKLELFFNLGSKHKQYQVIPLNAFAYYAATVSDNLDLPKLTDEPYVWNYPVQAYGNNRMQLVKKSMSADMIKYLSKDKMPDVYKAVNRLNAQQYHINPFILKCVLAAIDNEGFDNFLPEPITQDEINKAKYALSKIKRNAMNRKDYILKMMVEDEEEASSKLNMIAANKAINYFKEKSKDHRDVLSLYDKQKRFYKCLKIAQEYQLDTINFTYDMDSRGRIYAMQPWLNPLGDDFAKALLIFNKPQPFEAFDFGIHTANLFGMDKIPFDQRIEWLNDNMDNLLLIGEDPWKHWDILKSYDLGRKDKWQALAACRVWLEYANWCNAGMDADNFKTKVMCTADCTNSGLQVLSMVTRDEVIGPQVNIAPMPDGSVGDIYMVVAKKLPELLPNQVKDLAEVIKQEPKLGRKIVKRPTMVFSYDGTRYGMGTMTWEDHKDFEHPATDALDFKQCVAVGQSCYDTIVTVLNKSVELMDWLKDGVDALPNDHSPVLTWAMPDGFPAFAIKGKRKAVRGSAKINGERITLIVYEVLPQINKKKHKSAIAANWVHSWDSYLLRYVACHMPADAPLSTVHDAYSSSSYEMEVMRQIARTAFKIMADREYIKLQMATAFGIDRELPPAGTLSIHDIDKVDFFLS